MSKFRFEEIAINSTEKKKPVESDKYTYLGLEHLDPGTLKVSRFGSDVAPIGEKLVMKKGDVLFGKRRAYQKKVAIAPFDGIFSAHGMVLRPKTEVIDSEFFPLFISSDYFLDAAIKISVGSLSPTINWKDLKNLEFELPDLETQRQLAKILWSIIDTIENYKVLLTKTDELVKSQFIELLGRTKNKSIKKMSELVSYLPKSSMNAADGNEMGLYPFFTSGLEQNKFTNNYLYDDECLIIGNGGVANIQYYNGKFATGSHSFVTKSKTPTVKIRYLYSYFYSNMDILEEGFRGVGIKNIPKEYINGIDIPVPSIEQQDNLISLFEQSDKSKFELENCIKNAVSMYKKILKEYLG